MLPAFSLPQQSGLHVEHAHETLTLGHLLSNQDSQVFIGPLQYQEIDIGEVLPVQCARRALWLAKDGRLPFGMILGPAGRFGQTSGTSLEVVVPPSERGTDL